MERLQARGWLDDQRFALGYARYRTGRRYGRRRIERELRQRGVAADLIAQALAEVFPEEHDAPESAERALVRQRIEKRLAREKPPYNMRLFRSLYASLLRAGFPSAIILDELFARARFGRVSVEIPNLRDEGGEEEG